jgi:hypothetical protein
MEAAHCCVTLPKCRYASAAVRTHGRGSAPGAASLRALHDAAPHAAVPLLLEGLKLQPALSPQLQRQQALVGQAEERNHHEEVGTVLIDLWWAVVA